MSISQISIKVWTRTRYNCALFTSPIVADIANWFISICFRFLHANSLSLAFVAPHSIRVFNERLVEWHEDWIETEHNAAPVMHAELALFHKFPSRYCDISSCIHQVDSRRYFECFRIRYAARERHRVIAREFIFKIYSMLFYCCLFNFLRYPLFKKHFKWILQSWIDYQGDW